MLFELIASIDVNVLSLRIESGEIFIRTKSKQATDVLERLASMENVTSPQMTSPIVKSRGDEIITVKFSLQGESNREESEVANVTH